MRTILAIALAGITTLAHADNPLVINGLLSPADPIAFGHDGPNTPAADSFYYDLFTITVNTDGNYGFTMDSFAPTLAPWLGIYANNFTSADYFNPAPIDLTGNILGGGSGSVTIPLTAGTYQVVAASVDWIEEPDALDEGAYRITIDGPAGSDITLVPAPGTACILAAGGLLASRRRR